MVFEDEGREGSMAVLGARLVGDERNAVAGGVVA